MKSNQHIFNGIIFIQFNGTNTNERKIIETNEKSTY